MIRSQVEFPDDATNGAVGGRRPRIQDERLVREGERRHVLPRRLRPGRVAQADDLVGGQRAHLRPPRERQAAPPAILVEYLALRRASGALAPDDPVLDVAFPFLRFARVTELEGDEFVYLYEPAPTYDDPERALYRILCLDPRSSRRFRLYWRLVRPFSGLIRIAMLRAVAREATRPAAGPSTSRR